MVKPIQNLSSLHFYTAFMAGGAAIIQQKSHLNKINVFPVPDADTGTNLAATMVSIMENSRLSDSLKQTMDSIADSAILGARGNSGIIFAQFLHGIREQITDADQINLTRFAQLLKNAVRYLYEAVVEPVKGTIITVVEDWIKSVEFHAPGVTDFTELLQKSYQSAVQSLKETPQKLEVLARYNVVDAGAQGFVNFLEGILAQIKKGKLIKHPPKTSFAEVDKTTHIFKKYDVIEYRYCTEALLTQSGASVTELKNILKNYGNSAIVAGTQQKFHFHIHTNQPGELFQEIRTLGTISQIKVDDMLRQYETAHARKFPIALVTDSAADLPRELVERYQIQMIPFKISFGDNVYLDKLTLDPARFYEMLEQSRDLPRSSQPDHKVIRNLYDHLTAHYDQIFTVHISSQLTGVYDSAVKISKNYSDKEIHVIDSRHLSASEGLITLRVAQAIEAGDSFDTIVAASENWVKNTRILTDINSLKYMVKGGRVSPLTGLIAKLINLKPIVSMDQNGKGQAFGKSFSRSANMKKIIEIIKTEAADRKLWNYAVVHSNNPTRADEYASKLEKILNLPPVYIVDISPVIGVHNGLGTVAVAYMFE
ncbi:MAG: DegV family protein [Candidatus Neomarinimicrobiota bacterium]